MHNAFEPMVVVYRIVLGTAIIPERKCAFPPSQTRSEFWLDLMLEKVFEQRETLLFRPAFEMCCMGAGKVECFTSSFRMGADHWMGSAK